MMFEDATGDDMRNLQRWQENRQDIEKARSVANRVAMVTGVLSFKSALLHIIAHSLAPVGVSVERFAAMVVQVQHLEPPWGRTEIISA